MPRGCHPMESSPPCSGELGSIAEQIHQDQLGQRRIGIDDFGLNQLVLCPVIEHRAFVRLARRDVAIRQDPR